MNRGNCHFCGKPVTNLETAAFPVTGWEAERSQGGTNAIMARERKTDRIAHAVCVKADQKGLTRQEGML